MIKKKDRIASVFFLCRNIKEIVPFQTLISCQKGAECNTRQKCHRWVVLRRTSHWWHFLLEGVRCGLDKEKERMGCTVAYCPFALWIERSQMTPYHKKLIFFDDTSPVTSNVITLVVVAIEDNGVCAIAIVDKLGSTALNHSIVLIATC